MKGRVLIAAAMVVTAVATNQLTCARRVDGDTGQPTTPAPTAQVERICSPADSWAPCRASGDSEPIVPLGTRFITFHVTTLVEEDQAYCDEDKDLGIVEVGYDPTPTGADVTCAVLPR